MKDKSEKKGISIKLTWYFLILIVLPLFIVHDTINKAVNSERKTVCEDTAICGIIDTVVTIQEVLKFREDVKEGMRIDSIFLAMPTPILIDILMTHGTSLSNSYIVHIYESNKDYYKAINTGANIQQNYITPSDSVKNLCDPLRRRR